MLRLRTLLLALGGLAAAFAFAAPQARAEAVPVHATATLQGQHFLIHYVGDPALPGYIPQSEAGDVLGWAERAYGLYTSWGYTPPVDDSDGNGFLDIYVDPFSALPSPASLYHGYVVPDNGAAASTPGVIHVDATTGTNLHAIAHELFVLFEWQTFHAPAATWFQEGAAEWAAYGVEQFVTPSADSLGEPDRALDCIGTECGYPIPDSSTYDEWYDRKSNPGWSFFEYLSEKYGGADIVRQLLVQAAADGPMVPATQPIDEVLTAKGSSLSSAFNGWITARLNGDFQLVAIRGVLPQVFSNVATGGITASIPTTIVAVNHLASRYVEIDPGDGTTGDPCYAATLDLSVTIPSGVTSAPYYYPSAAVPVLPPPPAAPTATPVLVSLATPQALTISGNTASISVPWDTCTGGAAAYVSLPNATVNPNVNGNEFTISGKLTVNTKVLATPNLPPTPVKVTGSTVSSPSGAIVPTVELFGPAVIHLSGDDTSVKLIVSSDTDGKLQASLGSYALGTATLRAGGNDVEFALPLGALTSLRHAASTNTLTLTPYSTTGAAGTVLTRLVQIDATSTKVQAKAKAKPKAKKPKAKPKKHVTSHRR